MDICKTSIILTEKLRGDVSCYMEIYELAENLIASTETISHDDLDAIQEWFWRLRISYGANYDMNRLWHFRDSECTYGDIAVFILEVLNKAMA